MGNERRRLKVYELNSAQPNTYFGANSVVRLLPGTVHGLFRISDVFPSWMVPAQVKSAKVQIGVYGNAINLRMHKSTDVVAWDENEVTWNNADVLPAPVPWGTPGCAYAAGNIQVNCSGTTETLIFANDFILADVLAAVGGNYTEIRRGYVFSIDHLGGQSLVLDTIRNLDNPVLILELKSPVIVYATPAAAPAGAPFTAYVYVEPGDESLTGFNFVQGVVLTPPTSYSIEMQLPNGYKLYRLSMPAMAAGAYEIQLTTTSYEYRYGVNFVVGADSYTTFMGTLANNFIFGAGSGFETELISDAAVQLRASAMYAAVLHAAATGNPHSMTALDLGGDNIITAINSGTLKIDVARLHADVMTATEHHDTSVADHHDFATTIIGVSSLGIFGSGTFYVGHTKLRVDPLPAQSGIILTDDAGANGIQIGIDQSVIATRDYVQSVISGLDWQQSILNFVAVLPGFPGIGDRYVLTTDDHIYEWDGLGWIDITPNDGFAVYNEADSLAYVYNGIGWVPFANAFSHNSLSGIQGGAVGDYQHLTAVQLAALHARSHAMTSASDHTASNWSVFYSNGAGQVVELALGAAGDVLTSNGAAVAPSFAPAGAGHVRLHSMTNILDHSAGNWKVFYSNGAGQVIELSLGAAGEVLTSNGAAVAPSFQAPGAGHTRLHAMTDILDHSAGNWKVFYSNGAGQVIELSLGAAGEVLTSSGAAVAPTFAVIPNSHVRSHAMTSTSDHTATAWRVFYSDAAGNVQELALGAAGEVLTSAGAALAPTFAAIPNSHVRSHSMTSTSDHTATAWRVFYSDAAGNIQELALGAAGEVLTSAGAALAPTFSAIPNSHVRSHAMTSTSDHTSGNWKVFYSNGAGQVIELSLGAAGEVLTSSGAAVAPTFAVIPNSHVRSHAMTSTSDHTATAWRVFYSDAAGNVQELALGAAGEVLTSAGAALAPTFSAIPNSHVRSHAMTSTSDHTATAWRVFYSDAAGNVQELALGAAGDVLTSAGAALAPTFSAIPNSHVRSHAMTSTSDHSAGNWKVFYSNGAGQVIELSLGAAGEVLTSSGAAVAPTFAAIPNSHVRSHAMTSTSDHTATAWRVFYSDAAGNVQEIALGVAGDVLTSNGAAVAPSFQSPGAGHARLHTMTSASDHSAGNWKVFYSDGSGNVQELALGAAGEVLTSSGAAAAPTFSAIPNSHVRSHAITSTSDHTATAWRVFYSDGSGNIQEIALGASGDVLMSNGAAVAPSFQSPGAGHARLHTMTNVSDHSAGNWKVFYSDGSGNVQELSLGAAGEVLTSSGAAAAPTFSAIPNSHVRSHAMTSTSDHTATAWRVFYSDGSGNIQEIALGASGDVLMSNGAAVAPSFQSPGAGHARLHTMTNASDHSAGNWKVFYSDGSGNVQELSLGAAGEVLTSSGAAAAPTFSTIPNSHVRSHAMTSTSDHTATAWRVFYSDGSGNVQEIVLGSSGDVLTSAGAAAAPSFQAPTGGHTRLHSMTNVLDHSAGNWKVFYSNGAGQVIELSLGAAGEVLTSGGAAVAPTFSTIPNSHVRSHSMTSTSDHTAGNWKVFYSDGSGNVQELSLGAAGEVLTSSGAAAAPTFSAIPNSHVRSHSITSTSDHTATAWRVFYSDAAGNIQELTLGAAGEVLTSAGAALAPSFAAIPNSHTQLHTMTSTSDHSAGNWKVFYSNGTGRVGELALGAAGEVLTSNGAAVAPTFTAIPNSHVRSHSMTSTSDHTAGNWKVFYSNGSGQVIELSLGASGEVLTSNGAAVAPTFAAIPNSHVRSHSMTSTSDHTAGNWKVFYSNGSGQVIELALGAANEVLTSSGAAAAPTFAAVHSRSHTMASTSDHTATAWRVFYSDGSGNIQELVLGASGTVLTSAGAAAAPSFAAIPNSHVRSHSMTSTSDHTATAWRVFYSDGSGNVQELALGVANTVLTSNGAAAAPSFTAVHARSHAMTSTSDHTSGNWSVFYSNGSGQVIELALGASGYLKTNGVAAAPTWANPLGGTGTDHRIVRWDGTSALQDSLNTIDDSGNETVAGNLTVSGSTKAAGAFYASAVDPTNTNRLNYDGYFYATRVYNAVYNDIADYLPTRNNLGEIFYGRVYKVDSSGSASVVKRRKDMGAVGIASDTLGFGVGKKEGTNQIPIAIAGFVLAFVDKVYAPGTPLVVDNDGGLTKASWVERILFSERILATYLREEKGQIWNRVVVNGRSWVKVR